MEKKVVLKDMKPKKRVAYIWEYYKWYIICGTLAVIFVIYLIVNYVTRKEEVAHVLMVNANLEAMTENDNFLFDVFLEENGYNTEKQEIVVNDGLRVDPTGSDKSNYYAYQSVLTILEARGADIYLSDQDTFDLVASTGNLQDISKVLPDEMIEKYEDKLVFTTDPETNESYPCGIEITGNEWLEETGIYAGDCVMGAAYGLEENGLTEKMMSYILGEDKIH